VKNVLLGMNESKYIVQQKSNIFPLDILRHNSFNVAKLWDQGVAANMRLFPNRGDEQDQFDGREFYMKGIKFSMQLTFAADRLASRVRVWYSTSNPANIDPSYDDFFRNSQNNVMLDVRNNQNWPKARYLGEIRPIKDYGGGRPQSVYRNYYLPFNKFVRYEANIGDDGVINNTRFTNVPEKGYFIFVAYDDQGSTLLDNLVTSIEGTFTTYFKDT